MLDRFFLKYDQHTLYNELEIVIFRISFWCGEETRERFPTSSASIAIRQMPVR